MKKIKLRYFLIPLLLVYVIISGLILSKEGEKPNEDYIIEQYFEVLQEFGLDDSLNNYDSFEIWRKPPTIWLAFEAYGDTRYVENSQVFVEDSRLMKIEVLRVHLTSHYEEYVLNKFLNAENLGNDYLGLEDTMSSIGYKIKIYQSPSLSYHYHDLYVNSKEATNVKVNLNNKEVSLDEELSFYKGKSISDFDYLEYMNFFDYGIYLFLQVERVDFEKPEVSMEEINRIVEEYLRHERIALKIQ